MITLRVLQFISIEANLDSSTRYLVYLFKDDEIKARTEGPFLLFGFVGRISMQL